MPRPDRSLYFVLAHRYVEIALRYGDLRQLDGSIACVDCGEPANEYDHRDYMKPLAVEPVCRACNQARGPGLHRDPGEVGTKPPTLRQRFEAREAAAAPVEPRRATRLAVARTWKAERDARVVALYQSGQSMDAVSKVVGVSAPTVLSILRRNDVPTRPRGKPRATRPSERAQAMHAMHAMRATGKTFAEIGAAFGVSRQCVEQTLAKARSLIEHANQAA